MNEPRHLLRPCGLANVSRAHRSEGIDRERNSSLRYRLGNSRERLEGFLTRQTSIEAYRQIQAEGLLSAGRFRVYETLFSFGPLTQSEVWERIEKAAGHPVSKQNVTPLFAELLDRGVIATAGERPCRVTGRNCLLWDVTPNLPVEPPAKVSEVERLQKENKALERDVVLLKDRIVELEKVIHRRPDHSPRQKKFDF
jgi:hypothetical protein